MSQGVYVLGGGGRGGGHEFETNQQSLGFRDVECT